MRLVACQLHFFPARAGAQHFQRGALLGDVGIDLPELGAVVAIGQAHEDVAGADAIALLDQHLLDQAVDHGPDVGVLRRIHLELARDFQLHAPEEEQRGPGGNRGGFDETRVNRGQARARRKRRKRRHRAQAACGAPERTLKCHSQQAGEGDESGALVLLDHVAAEPHRHDAQDPP